MKNIILFIYLSILSFSCTKPNRGAYLKAASLEMLTSNFSGWWNYHYNKIMLSSDFVPLNENAKKISKKKFLEQLTTGKYIVESIDNTSNVSYKLFRIPEKADDEISNTIKYLSATAYKHFKMEGLKFPDFRFSDLNDKEYTQESLLNKTTIIKTWFVNCGACIAEIPDLNMLFNTYKNNNKLQFISLATDNQNELETFLTKKRFNYPVVANQKEFIEEKLNLAIYPSHIVIDKYGKIKKVFNNAEALIGYINYTIKPIKEVNYKDLPPPPEPK